MRRPPAHLVLDAGGLAQLAERTPRALALLTALADAGLWPPLVPSAVIAESLTGDDDVDRRRSSLIGCCDVVEQLPATLARRAAWLRAAAGRGSATDAVVVALAEPGGAVLVRRNAAVEAMALFANDVFVERA